MGLGQNFLTRVGSIFCCSGWVGSDIYGLGLNFENFPLKRQIFQLFSLRVKKNCFGSGRKVPRSKSGWPLIYCRSKVSSGRVRSGPISNWEYDTTLHLQSGVKTMYFFFFYRNKIQSVLVCWMSKPYSLPNRWTITMKFDRKAQLNSVVKTAIALHPYPPHPGSHHDWCIIWLFSPPVLRGRWGGSGLVQIGSQPTITIFVTCWTYFVLLTVFKNVSFSF